MSAPWVASGVIHIALLAALLAYRIPEPPAEVQREVVTPLIFYKPPPIQAKLIAPRLPPSISRPAPKPAPLVVVKQLPPPPIVERPKTTIAVPAPEPVQQIASAPPPTTQLKAPDLPARPSPPPVPVKTGVFETAGQSPNARTPSPRLEVQTGGFASTEAPRGASANGSATGAVHLGGFGDSKSATSQSGNGRQLIADAGFGSGNGAANRPGNGRAQQVSDAGFSSGTSKAAPAARRAETAPNETPVEVLWKPKPVYTPEARAKKLEGDIALEVVFHATGAIQVLRVVRGLGSGLDESARIAAEQIRFRPGKKDGVPVDRTGLVLITFELS